MNNKKIVLQEELYDQILNGFTQTKGKIDKKLHVLNAVYKKRLVAVGEKFFNNKETHNFNKTYIQSLRGMSGVDDLLKLVLKKEKEKEEEEEIDPDEEAAESDEKTDKSIFNIFAMLKMYNAIQVFKNFYEGYKKIKKIKDDLGNVFLEIREIEDNTNLPTDIKNVLKLQVWEKFFTESTNDVLVRGSYDIVKSFDESRLINGFFDLLDEAIKRAGITAGVKFGVFVLSTALTGGAGAMAWLGKGAQFINYAHTAYATAQLIDFISEPMRELAQSFDEDQAERFRDEIRNFVQRGAAQAAEINSKVDAVRDDVHDLLDPKRYFENQVERFQNEISEDVFSVRRIASRGSNLLSQSGVLRIGQNVGVGRFERNGNNTFRFVIPRIRNNVFDSISFAHTLKYNVTLSQSAFEKMYDKNTGLYALNSLIDLYEKILTFYSDFYTNDWMKMIKGGEDKFLELFENSRKTHNDRLEEYNRQRENVQNETPQSDVQSGTTNNSQRTTFAPRNPQRNRLRLSERTLQPIHPIFYNGALIGIQLKLMDSNDNEIEIKVKDWFDDQDNVIKSLHQNGSDLLSLKNYVIYHTNLDLIRDGTLCIVDEEKKTSEILKEILYQIENERRS